MGAIAIETPKHFEKELKTIADTEHIAESVAIKKLLDMGVQKWKEERALKLLEEGKVTLWKASELAGVSLWEMLNLVEKRNISLPLSASDVIEDIKDAIKDEFHS